MRRCLFIVFALLMSTQLLAAELPRDPNSYFFNDTFGDFHEELANAKAAGKKGIFLFFEMKECPFCHYMRTNVLNQPQIQDYYRKNFLNFHVDIEGDVEMNDFSGKSISQKDFSLKEYRVRATPVLAFFDLNGKLIYRYTGRTGDGAEFLLMGKYVADGLYKTTHFSQYKRQMRDR